MNPLLKTLRTKTAGFWSTQTKKRPPLVSEVEGSSPFKMPSKSWLSDHGYDEGDVAEMELGDGPRSIRMRNEIRHAFKEQTMNPSLKTLRTKAAGLFGGGGDEKRIDAYYADINSAGNINKANSVLAGLAKKHRMSASDVPMSMVAKHRHFQALQKRHGVNHDWVTGKASVMKTAGIWALPAECRFPIDTAELVKTAAAAFEGQLENMEPAQRLVCARRVCERAAELGVHVESSLAYKYAGANLSPFFAQFLALRKEASCHLADSELDMLAAAASRLSLINDVNTRVKGLDKVAVALENFDRGHGLEGHWDNFFPDPAYSVYGQTLIRGERLTRAVKVAGYEVDSQMLESADWEGLRGRLDDSVINGLRDAGSDRLVVFDSLPSPHKDIIVQALVSA